MINSTVFKTAYEGYTHSLNGREKKAVKAYTQMYKEGIKNPTQAKFDMEAAHKKATYDYDTNTTNSELKTIFNCMKSVGRTMIDSIFNKEYRTAENAFNKKYSELYPRTGFAREIIMAERNMP